MRGKFHLFSILLLICFTCYGQIDFGRKGKEVELYRKALKADKAITRGDYGEVHSLLVIKKGKLVFENYYNGWKQDSIHQAQSMTKSIIATVLGCALQKKIIENVKEEIVKYFPKYKELNKEVTTITIQDLLTQRHGFKWQESPWESPDNNWRNLLNTSGDWYRSILGTELKDKPGTIFNYSNAAPVLISGIVQNASKVNIENFTINNLFEPLRIQKYNFWQGNGGPSRNGMAMVWLRPRDMAKIGQLYLQKGKWYGNQVIPKDYAQKATSSIVKAAEGNPIYKQFDYGYLWWRNPVNRNGKAHNIFMARGAGGQMIIVEPERKLVVVITAWNLRTPNRVQLIFDDYLSNTK